MTLRDQYEEALAAWHAARSALLSDRLTLARKAAQMHEADVEQDDAVAEYFAGRRAEMAARVAADETRLEALAATAEEIRIAMVTEDLHQTLAAYDEALRAAADYLAALDDAVARVEQLSRRATDLAESLPPTAERQHRDADAAAERAAAIADAVQRLRQAITPAP